MFRAVDVSLLCSVRCRYQHLTGQAVRKLASPHVVACFCHVHVEKGTCTQLVLLLLVLYSCFCYLQPVLVPR